MTLFRAFISGIVIPSIILPFLLIVALSFDFDELLMTPFIHFIPLLWGVWNLLYFAVCKSFLPGSEEARLFLSGAILGILVAVVGVFYLDIPAVVGLAEQLIYIPLIAAPILYGLLWAYGVKYINRVVGIHSA